MAGCVLRGDDVDHHCDKHRRKVLPLGLTMTELCVALVCGEGVQTNAWPTQQLLCSSQMSGTVFAPRACSRCTLLAVYECCLHRLPGVVVAWAVATTCSARCIHNGRSDHCLQDHRIQATVEPCLCSVIIQIVPSPWPRASIFASIIAVRFALPLFE